MKLFRFGKPGHERPGVLLESGRQIDVSGHTDDFTSGFLAGDGLGTLSKWLKVNADKCPDVPGDVRIGPPIKDPSKIICVGLNYAKHAEESGMEPPPEPLIFFKSTTALCGPFDDVIIPKNSKKTDWEVEIAIVIGKKAQYVEVENALDFVAGYTLHNDVSEREFQLERGGQWVKGKSADTFAPIGPYLTTSDEIPDPNNMKLWLKLNGELIQDSSTSDLIFNMQTLVSSISQYMTLLPGDIISTGTPSGVGLGFKPPKFLKEGDVMELGADHLGISRQTAVNYSAS